MGINRKHERKDKMVHSHLTCCYSVLMCMSFSIQTYVFKRMYVCVQQQNVTKTIRSQSMVESTNTNVTEHNGIVLSVIFHYLAEFSHHSVRKRVEIV